MPDAKFYEWVESEITHGLSNEKEALYDAWANMRFYEGEYEEFPTRWPDEDGYDKQEQYRRTSAVMTRAVTLMTQDLYKHDPIRRLATPDATAWLAKVYSDNAMSAKWPRADELAVVGDYSAFQFVGTEDPASPIKVHLWGRDQLIVWVDPDDPTEPAAVATIDLYDGHRRLTLWTPDEIVYYVTAKGDDKPGTGQASFREDPDKPRRPNPYREPEARPGEDEPRGILPFAFVHFRFPAQKFDTPGPGCALRRLNDWINARFDWSGEGIRYLTKPIGVAAGVSANWKPPARLKPGSWITLQADELDVAGAGPVPSLNYITPPTEWVAADWQDLNNGLDHEMQMHGLPPSVFRMIQSGAASGVSIICEQAPLTKWVEGRQEPFSHYERRAAFKAMLVAAAHLRNHKRPGDAGKLEQWVKAGVFSMRWGPLYMLLPGPERDQADQWRIDAGIANQVTILMERERLTEEEAFERLKQLAEQNKQIAALGIQTKADRDMQAKADQFDQQQEQQAKGGDDKGQGKPADTKPKKGAGDANDDE